MLPVPVPVPLPGVAPLSGGVAGGVLVPSGLVVVSGVTPGVLVDGVTGRVPSGVAAGVVAGAASGVVAEAAGVAGVAAAVSLRLLQPPSSAQASALAKSSLPVVRSVAVMMIPFR